MDVRILGINLGKNSCSAVGLDAAGQVVLRCESVVAPAAKLPGCVVAMEACCGAHHLGRQLAAQGHQVRLMSPEYVRPHLKAQKNDDRDAEAITEAADDAVRCALPHPSPRLHLPRSRAWDLAHESPSADSAASRQSVRRCAPATNAAPAARRYGRS